MKYIVVTGGVVSGLGKGITISSIGRILKSSGLRVTSIKIDPYLNVDAGTMSPFEHGETFVLDDGGETDLDLGNYERFLDITLTGKHNITSGKVYKEVISQERRGDYLGKTVQIVPHATDMVQKWLKEVALLSVDGTGAEPDVCLIEVGGTVGDIESMVFLEALRQFQFQAGRENIVFVHVSLVPVLGSVGEQKTKPTQHSVKELRALGLSPDIIVCRSAQLLEASTKAKISTFCHVTPDCIISVHDVSNIYHVPLILAAQGVHSILKQRLNLAHMRAEPDLASWSSLAHTVDSYSRSVEVALVGKYVGLEDAYLSVVKALSHASMHLNVNIKVRWVESSHLDEETLKAEPDKHAAAWAQLRDPTVCGIIVPGGFGVRGVEGKIAAIQHARVNKVPFLGLCLGMQVAVIEYARNVLGLAGANSTEFDAQTKHPAVIFMPEGDPLHMGGTMRLGARSTLIATRIDAPYPSTDGLSAAVDGTAVGGEEGSASAAPRTPLSKIKTAAGTGTAGASAVVDHGRSLASEVYGFQHSTEPIVSISERHRHRYEVNPAMVSQLEAAGLRFTGRDDKGERMEIAELSRDQHPHFLGVQYHPELKSRPNRPSPPFFSFAAVVCGQADQLSKAGTMWREYDEGKKKEIAWIYSPKSGLKKRPVSALSSPVAGGAAGTADGAVIGSAAKLAKADL